ncbi:MAG: His/Gly/Thr/Pro-type tRNA ligase C-terminal domain-containing protein, partial [Gammaproteobacteria bacterium]|nr:His/Gly/Thr/Pro-type tRNA ligase C-terminal domain-containing protein [Gammaproteobacteria bacterium]
KALNTTVLNENGKAVVIKMGCYGIGVSRIVASAIEQNNDDKGIIWPSAIAPFSVVICPMNMHKSQRVKDAAEKVYNQLLEAGIDTLLDDRNQRAGAMFADMELIGIPHRLTIGERGLDQGIIEYLNRKTSESGELSINTLIEDLAKKVI